MSKRPIWLIAAAMAVVLTVAGIAYAAQKPTVVRLGNLVLTLNGGVTPTAMPKHERVPIGFHASGDLETVDGSHPPAVEEAVFDVDRDVAIDVGGIPVCHRGQLEASTSAAAKRACPGAILGEGKATVEVAFPEQKPFQASGPLILFNGGTRGGVTTFYFQTYVAIPAPSAIVTTSKITREHKGPYGLRIVTSVPKIAGGSGSLTHFELGASRYVKYRGRVHSFLFARCSDGKFLARGQVKFRDGTVMSGGLIRTCEAAG